MTPSNENELTQAVLQRLDGASDPRFAQIMHRWSRTCMPSSARWT